MDLFGSKSKEENAEQVLEQLDTNASKKTIIKEIDNALGRNYDVGFEEGKMVAEGDDRKFWIGVITAGIALVNTIILVLAAWGKIALA